MKLKERIERFFHDKLGWGYVKDGIEGFDGVSFMSHCKYCDKKLLRDSNGDWFHV